MSVIIDYFKREDWKQVREIFWQGIETGNSTFTKEPPGFEQWSSDYVLESCHVARLNNEVVGWTALKSVSNRPVFSGVAEVSVYVRNINRGLGVGNMLLERIIEWSEENGYWMLQSNVFPENTASIALHKKFGFKEVGVRERIGQMDGIWRDIVLMDRRSKKVGV